MLENCTASVYYATTSFGPVSALCAALVGVTILPDTRGENLLGEMFDAINSRYRLFSNTVQCYSIDPLVTV
jgi:hypothetical protein